MPYQDEGGDEWPVPYLSVVATSDGTELVVEPSAIPIEGNGVPGDQIPFTVMPDEGDVLHVTTKELNSALTDTRVTANEDHPVLLFSGHMAAYIPEGVADSDYLEEQLPGIRFWGKTFVASRMPIRDVLC